MKKIALLLSLIISLLNTHNLEAQKKTKKLKRPSSRVGIIKVDKFVRESFNLYDKVYRYDDYTETSKSLTDDDYEILLDAVSDSQKVSSSAPNVLRSLDGANVMKQAKGTMQINRSQKALRYSLRTAKKLLTTKHKKDDDMTEDTTVSDTKTPSESSTNSNGKTSDSSSNNGMQKKQPDEKISYWMSYDFIPGKEVIFFDNMQNEDYGDFPRRWDMMSGNAEIGRFGNEKVLLFYNNMGTTIKPLLKEKEYLPDAFTIEFDVYFDGVSTDRDSSFKLFFNNDNYNPITISSWFPFEIKYKKFKFSTSKYKEIRNFNGWHHIAISYHKGYLKMYFDEQKVLNIPRFDVVPTSIGKIKVSYTESSKQKRVVTMKNFKISKGGGKPYAQIIADGKFVTHGILFDVGKATLKAQSSGVFKRVMDMMIDNPDWKFEIVGHTDSDGEDTANLALSQKRADAVKKALVARKIDASRLTTTGKGESEPLNKNATIEEKANNRRVEFILKK